MQERRSFKRVEFDRDIHCNARERGFNADEITPSINISGGGIGLTPSIGLEQCQPVSLEINVPGYNRALCVRGEVIWTRTEPETQRTRAGIKFTKIDSYDRQMILDYVHFG